MEVDKLIIGGLVAVVAYFLRSTMQDQKDTKGDVSDNSNRISLLELDSANSKSKITALELESNSNKNKVSLLEQEAHSNKSYFNEKFDVLFNELREMRTDLKQINSK